MEKVKTKKKERLSGWESFRPYTSAASVLSTFWEFIDGWDHLGEDMRELTSWGRVRVLEYTFPEYPDAAALFVVEFRKRPQEDGRPLRFGGLPQIDSGVSTWCRREVVRFDRGEVFQIPVYIEKGVKPDA